MNGGGLTIYHGTIHDTGAGWDKKHQDVNPKEWIDVWIENKPKLPINHTLADKWGNPWLPVTICCADCPFSKKG